VFEALYDALPDGCIESDVLLFSTSVGAPRGPWRTRAALREGVRRDARFPRHSTALVDALGDGVARAGGRVAPIRLAIVATDGQENASSRRELAQVIGDAQRTGTRIVSFGSLLSDVDFLTDIGKQTGGFFVFRADARELIADGQTVARLLAASQRVHVDDPRLARASHVVLTLGGRTTRLPLR
jgi:hypothetical protein